MKKLLLVITCLAFTNVFLGQILSITPNSGVVGQQLSVTITGNIEFYQASTVENVSFSDQFSNFLTVDNVNWNFSDSIEVLLTIPNNAKLGDYNVNVFNPDYGLNQTLMNGFKVMSDKNVTTTYTSTYEDLNADGFTNVGDVVNYQFTITNGTSLPISNIRIFESNLEFFGRSIASLNPGISDSTTFKSIYFITQEDINQGFVYESFVYFGSDQEDPFSIFPSRVPLTITISDGIKLNAFLDKNSNNIQDVGESNFKLGNFTTQLNAESIKTINSSSGIHYIYETNPLNSYKLGYTIPDSYASKYTLPTTNYNAVSVANGSGITTYNFPVKETPFNDLSVNVYSWGALLLPRPGFEYSNSIRYTNNGNQTVASGTVTFNKDSAISIISVSQSGTIATPTGFSYTFSNLLPQESRTITVKMQVPVIPTVALGQLVLNSASITTPTNDINVTNNSSDLFSIIVGSYDPNDKTESHGGKILHSTFTNNDYLTYNIRFENTGTAEAINVRVTDVLEDKLDETSIEMITTSEPNYTLERVGKNLTWQFNGINLPPSSPSSTTIGHGNILFKIKPKVGFKVGDVITNTASIYFDFNPPIVTEPCITEFTANLSTSNFNEFKSLKVYPNPVNDILKIENNDTIDNVEVTSILGQKMTKKNVANLQTEINLNQFSNGIYFVKIVSKGNEKVVKFIKE